jgi:hypothetical protein
MPGWPGRFDEQDLVAADAEMAVGQAAQLRRRQRDGLANAIEDDEVVAQSMHLDEWHLHRRSAAWRRRKQ